jgi:hypothetical protein
MYITLQSHSEGRGKVSKQTKFSEAVIQIYLALEYINSF